MIIVINKLLLTIYQKLLDQDFQLKLKDSKYKNLENETKNLVKENEYLKAKLEKYNYQRQKMKKKEQDVELAMALEQIRAMENNEEYNPHLGTISKLNI